MFPPTYQSWDTILTQLNASIILNLAVTLILAFAVYKVLTKLLNTASPILRLLDDVKTDLVTRAQAVQTDLNAFIERLDATTPIIDAGTAGLARLKATMGLLHLGLIAILGYLLCLHSAFLLTGIALRKTSSH